MKPKEITLGDFVLDLYERVALETADTDHAAIVCAAAVNERIAIEPDPGDRSALDAGEVPRESAVNLRRPPTNDGCTLQRRRVA